MNSDQSAPASKPLSTTCRIPLSPAESTVFQEGVRRFRRSLLNMAGGSVSWRLFLGSSVAVLIGGLTMACLGPNSQTPGSLQAKSTRQNASPKTAGLELEVTRPKQPQIELTVSTNPEKSGQEPAEYVDPFVPENQVKPKYVHALHLATQDGVPEPNAIRQVSRRRNEPSSPASLMGTIEASDDASSAPSLNPLRNHERSRSRDR